MVAPQPRGEAADYYQNAPPQGGHNNNYGNPQYQMQNPQDESQKYQQQPQEYGRDYGPNNGQAAYGEKPTFEQAFTIERPKWNDLWAGMLV